MKFNYNRKKSLLFLPALLFIAPILSMESPKLGIGSIKEFASQHTLITAAGGITTAAVGIGTAYYFIKEVKQKRERSQGIYLPITEEDKQVRESKLASRCMLEVRNTGGAVSIFPSDEDNIIRVCITKCAAKGHLNDVEPIIHFNKKAYNGIIKIGIKNNVSNPQAYINYEISAPNVNGNKAYIAVRTDNGDVIIRGRKQNALAVLSLTVETNSGNQKFKNIIGPVTSFSTSGNKTIKRVMGRVFSKQDSGNIVASDIEGRVIVINKKGKKELKNITHRAKGKEAVGLRKEVPTPQGKGKERNNGNGTLGLGTQESSTTTIKGGKRTVIIEDIDE